MAVRAISWFPFNQHKGWTVLIAVASVGVFFLLMFLWFLAALVFRLRFQFGLLSLLVLTVVVALPFAWLETEMKQAREQKGVVEAIEKAGGTFLMIISGSILSALRCRLRSHRGQRGCGDCWEMTSL